MSKLEVTFGADKVLFVNPKTEKAEGFVYYEHLDGKTAASQLRKEVDGRPNVSRAALSILIEVLQNDRLQGYKGKTPFNESSPKEFKQAMRETESAHLRPLFMEQLPKAMEQVEREKQADKYISELQGGGVYSNVKTEVCKYFTQAGKLPCVYDNKGHADVSKLLSVDAIKKLMANLKAEQPQEENSGYKDKWVKRIAALSAEFNDRNGEDKPTAEETTVAVNALKAMLATFEGISREYSELRTKAVATVKESGSINSQAKAATSKASRKHEPALV